MALPKELSLRGFIALLAWDDAEALEALSLTVLARTPLSLGGRGFHPQTTMGYKLGFSQNYHTFASTLLTNIILCSKFL